MNKSNELSVWLWLQIENFYEIISLETITVTQDWSLDGSDSNWLILGDTCDQTVLCFSSHLVQQTMQSVSKEIWVFQSNLISKPKLNNHFIRNGINCYVVCLNNLFFFSSHFTSLVSHSVVISIISSHVLLLLIRSPSFAHSPTPNSEANFVCRITKMQYLWQQH